MRPLHLLLEREGIIMQSKSDAYAQAGVDITAGYRAVELMKGFIQRTRTPGVLSDIGGFGGLFSIGKDYEDPILVSGTDGVGTKLKLAFLMDRHNTIGIDAVAMCVNDIICCGAKPLFFLDYIACGKNIPEKIASIVQGVAEGCVQAGAALIGGETAEMPGFYPEDEYDLAGFSVGIIDRKDIIDSSKMKENDIVIALPSTGVHSNGYSLVREILNNKHLSLDQPFENSEKSLGEALLEPTKIYVKPILSLLKEVKVRGISNITGGGFYENIPRSIPEGLGAKIDREALRVLPIFSFLQKEGEISDHDMFNTFNMGVGMVLVICPKDQDRALDILRQEGVDAYPIGQIVRSDERILL